MKNEPAFPVPDSRYTDQAKGMTLRDYFAAKAMQGLIMKWSLPENGEFRYADPETCASMSYKLSDAMLAERAK